MNKSDLILLIPLILIVSPVFFVNSQSQFGTTVRNVIAMVADNLTSVSPAPTVGFSTPTEGIQEFDTPTPTSLPTKLVPIQPYQAPNTNTQQISTTISEGELIVAINTYRQAHGLSKLNTNESLCRETRKRVQDMVSLNAGKAYGNITLNHDGMAQDVQSGVLANTVGKNHYGENIASAFCNRVTDGVQVNVTTGTQLVEWCFDASVGHRENLLNPQWTDVCSSGQFPYYVQTFAY